MWFCEFMKLDNIPVRPGGGLTPGELNIARILTPVPLFAGCRSNSAFSIT
jgi:hypothetical protein